MSLSPSQHSREGGNPEQLITDHLDIWTSAIQPKASAGRGSSKKYELYGIKKLRELILELAVRGLLVPQDPNDEPASVLLEKIAAEKERLVKEGKIKNQNKSKPFDVADSAVTLPLGWCISDFGDITFNRDAERIPLSVSERSGRSGKYDYYGASGVIDSIDDFLFDKPLLLIGEDGANLVSRSTPIAFLAYGKYWVNNHAHVIDGISEGFLKYLALYINSISLLPYITGMAQPKMNQAKMNSIPIWIPPESEQFRIVAKVDELMALCDQLEQQTEANLDAHQTLVETLLNALVDAAQSRDDASVFEQAWQRIADHFDVLFTTEHSIDQLKQTILQLAVMGKLVPQDPNDEPASVLLEKIAAEKARLVKEGKIKVSKTLVSFAGLDEMKFELSENWEWVRLSDIADIVRGGSPRPAGDPKFYDGPIPFLKVGDVTNNKGKFVEGYTATIKEEGLKKTRFIDVRTVLLSNSGATLGVPAICDFPTTFNDGIAAFVEKSSAVLDEYLYLYLKTLTSWFLNVASRGQGQPNLNTDIIKSTWFPLPPINEQKQIVSMADSLIGICDALLVRIQESENTQTKLAALMTEKSFNN